MEQVLVETATHSAHGTMTRGGSRGVGSSTNMSEKGRVHEVGKLRPDVAKLGRAVLTKPGTEVATLPCMMEGKVGEVRVVDPDQGSFGMNRSWQHEWRAP